MNRWRLSHRADKEALPLADRHYNRQKVGSPQFVPPGRCVVLKAGDPVKAVWITSWPFAQYVKHAWAGAWVNSLFRNEGAGLSSELIREAVTATLQVWPDPPALGIVTFVDAKKTRHKRDPGRCYRKAGFKHVGFTKGGLWAFQLSQEEIWKLRTSAPSSGENTISVAESTGSSLPSSSSLEQLPIAWSMPLE